MSKVLWSLINTGASQGLNALLLILLGNLLAPDQLGMYTAVMMAALHVGALAVMKFGGAVVQRLNDASLQSARQDYFVNGLAATLAMTLLVALAAGLGRPLLASLFQVQDRATLLWFVPPLIVVMSLRLFFEQCLEAGLRMKAKALINAGAGLIQLGIVGGCGLAQALGVADVLWALCIGNAISLAGMSALCLRQFGLALWRLRIDLMGDLLRFTGWLHVGTVLVFLDQNVDMFLVNRFLPRSDLAVYGYAWRLGMLTIVLGTSISHVTFPLLSQQFSSGDIEGARRLYRMAVSIVFSVLSVLALAFFFHAEGLIRLVLPDTYLGLLPPLLILLPAIVAFGTFCSVGSIFAAMRSPQTAVWPLMIALVLNAGLSYWLIPRFGLVGAAAATSASFLFRALVGMALVEKRTQTGFPYARLALVFLAFVAAVAVGRGLTDYWLLKEALLAAFVAVVWRLLLSREQRRQIKEIVLRQAPLCT